MIRIDTKYKIKGNISILVILVLLASSLIWVLTMNFLKQMISYTNDAYSYHKSYYFAKAGLELALVQVDNSGIWFSNILSGKDSIFSDNFVCDNCWFDVDIKWLTQYLSNKFWLSTGCDDNTAFFIKWWESIIIPMFSQRSPISNYSVFDQNIQYNFDLLKYRNYMTFVKNQPYNWNINLWLIILSGDDIQRDFLFIKSYDTTQDVFQKYFKEFDDFYWDLLNKNNYFSYVIISNSSQEDLSFCVRLDDFNQWWVLKSAFLPTMNFFISSIWNFMGRDIGLQAIYGQPVPSFLANTYLQ